MRKGVKCAAELLEDRYGATCRAWLVTLTYRPGAEHRRKQVTEYLKHVRDWCRYRRAAFGYVWVLELTQAGVPHYHLMIWLQRGYRLPKGDRCGWWPHGMTQTARAKSPVGYLIKYASKGIDVSQDLPRGARLFGCGGLSLSDRHTRSWRMLPEYVREAFNEGDKVIRAPGGGWVSLESGEWLKGVRLLFYNHRIYATKGTEQ